jgi:hypothetical protein
MRWQTTIRVSNREVKVLVTDELGDEVIRARLPRHPDHPRSLLTFLESLALWSGSPLTAAISVAVSGPALCDGDLFGGPFWPVDSALVRLAFVDRPRGRRLRGLGSFRDVLSLHGRVEP